MHPPKTAFERFPGDATRVDSSAAPVSPITPKTSKQQAENQAGKAEHGQAQSVPGTAERKLVARLGERLGDEQGELDRKGTFLRAIDRLEVCQPGFAAMCSRSIEALAPLYT